MGFVGGTTAKVFETKHKIFPYDRYKEPYNTQSHMADLARNADIAFLCVPTPMKKSGDIDVEPMHHSLRLLTESAEIAGRPQKDLLVTVRSTAVSGTTDYFAEKYQQFRFAFNPEFLREKHALEDMLRTEIATLGVEDARSREQLEKLYRERFPEVKFRVYDRKTAEMIKYARNAALAAQVMIFNDIFRICRALKIDYESVRESMTDDSRIGTNTQVPGHDGQFGFGGKCFPKDLSALVYLARQNHVDPHVLAEAIRSNLEVRKIKDWLEIPGAVSENNNFGGNTKSPKQ
jgi:UDPglucose 6-dehydrogenase